MTQLGTANMEIFAFSMYEHTHTQGYINDFINFTYFIISIGSPPSYLWSRRPPADPVIHDSQSLYAILTFGVFTFPDGFIIYHFSLEKKKRNGFSAK